MVGWGAGSGPGDRDDGFGVSPRPAPSADCTRRWRVSTARSSCSTRSCNDLLSFSGMITPHSRLWPNIYDERAATLATIRFTQYRVAVVIPPVAAQWTSAFQSRERSHAPTPESATASENSGVRPAPRTLVATMAAQTRVAKGRRDPSPSMNHPSCDSIWLSMTTSTLELFDQSPPDQLQAWCQCNRIRDLRGWSKSSDEIPARDEPGLWGCGLGTTGA